ncbi:MAG: ABC transporter permease [Solirubrobacterales bacterium]
MADDSFLTLLLISAVALSAPLLFAALGELVSETAGVINIELEGMMLAGAFCGVLGTYLSGSLAVGFLFSAAGGLLVGLLHGVACFVFRANQVVSGIVLNILALGLTAFFLSSYLGDRVTQSIGGLEDVSIPLLSDLPVLGPALFDQDVMVYAAFALVAACWWVLTRTKVGLALKAAGERPEAAESLGVDVGRVRWAVVCCCGVMAGVGGGQLALAGIGLFTPNMTAGRGFIALAAVITGGWRAVGVLAAVLLFATADAFQVRADAIGIDIPYQFLAMLPYIATLLALAGFLSRRRAPAGLATNYFRD